MEIEHNGDDAPKDPHYVFLELQWAREWPAQGRNVSLF